MKYTVRDSEGNSVEFEADNWMDAAAAALAEFEIDVNALGTLVCSPREDGSVHVFEKRSGLWWSVHEPKVAPTVRVVASARSAVLQDSVVDDDEWEDPTGVYDSPPPALTMAKPSLQPEEPVESLAERLFDLSMDILGEEETEAANMALSVLEEFVKAEAMSVVRGSLNDARLTYISARGSVADKIIGRKIAFGHGLVGTCYDDRETLLVRNARDSMLFSKSFDEETGFVTRDVLCVPVLDDAGAVYGVIQVLNPTAPAFGDEDIEAVESIARTLASALAT